ncbi:hypothetical protein D3C78_882180 [compost metagenome]
MNRREDFHRDFTRVITHELLIDLDDTAELNVKLLRILMRQVKIYHVLPVDTQLLIDAHAEYFTSCDVTRNKVAVCRIFLLQEVPWLSVLVRPDPAALTACRFRHQTKLVIPWNSCRVNLNKFAVRVINALLINSTCRCTCIDNGIRCFAENNPRAAGGQNNCVCPNGLYFHRAQVLCRNTTAYTVIVDYCTKEFMMLEFVDKTCRLPASNLLVESIQQLLAGRRTRKCST